MGNRSLMEGKLEVGRVNTGGGAAWKLARTEGQWAIAKWP